MNPYGYKRSLEPAAASRDAGPQISASVKMPVVGQCDLKCHVDLASSLRWSRLALES